MSSRSLNSLTEQELRAHSEAMQYFADQLKQFPANWETVKHLEQDIAKIALAVLAVSNRSSNGSLVMADDGSQWHKSIDLFDNILVCHRDTAHGMEYAIVESTRPGANEIATKGRNAVDVLKTFIHDKRRDLEIRSENMTAQINEFLVGKYPGLDLSRLSKRFARQFSY
jgi:hypothetical protein